MNGTELALPETHAETNQIAAIAEQMGVTTERALALSEKFSPFYFNALKIIEEAKSVDVTSADQVDEINKARVLADTIGNIRIITEKARVIEKASALAEGQAIDKVARYIREAIKPVEDRLYFHAEFAKREQELKRAQMVASREQALRDLGVDFTAYDLALMTEEAFTDLLSDLTTAREARLKQEQEDEERHLKEDADRVAEEKRIREDNARLKQERDAAQAKVDAAAKLAKAEKDKADAKLLKERTEAAAVLKAEQDRTRRLQEEATAAKVAKEKEEWNRQRALEKEQMAMQAELDRAAQAPDKEKLLTFAAMIRDLPLPAVSTPAAKKAIVTIQEQQTKFVAWIQSHVKAAMP